MHKLSKVRVRVDDVAERSMGVAVAQQQKAVVRVDRDCVFDVRRMKVEACGR